MDEKKRMLNSLGALINYMEEGIRDYLHDNTLEDYMDHGNFDEDYQLLKAAIKIRNFVKADGFPWWATFSVAEVNPEDATHSDTRE